MKAIIPAAGMGTRLLPATKSMPKEMLPVVDKPVIQYVVEEAVASGIEDIIIVTGRGKRAIEDHFDHSFELEHHLLKKGKQEEFDQVRAISDLARIHYVRQAEPLGLGHAVLCAERFIGDEPFAVLLGDDIVVHDTPATKELIDVHEETGASVISVLPVPKRDISKYGVIRGRNVDQDRGVYEVAEFVEKPAPEKAPSNLAAMGRYVLTPQVFDLLKATPPGFGGEVQLTDALAQLCSGGKLFAREFRGKRLDVGSVRGFLEANLFMALQRGDLAADVQGMMRDLQGA